MFRCEVSNEFPTFETVSTAEILTVVGRSRFSQKDLGVTLKISYSDTGGPVRDGAPRVRGARRLAQHQLRRVRRAAPAHPHMVGGTTL